MCGEQLEVQFRALVQLYAAKGIECTDHLRLKSKQPTTHASVDCGQLLTLGQAVTCVPTKNQIHVAFSTSLRYERI